MGSLQTIFDGRVPQTEVPPPPLEQQRACHCCGQVIGNLAHEAVFGWKYILGHCDPALIKAAKNTDHRAKTAQNDSHKEKLSVSRDQKAEQIAALRTPEARKELAEKYAIPGHMIDTIARALETGGRLHVAGGVQTVEPPSQTVLGPGSFEWKR